MHMIKRRRRPNTVYEYSIDFVKLISSNNSGDHIITLDKSDYEKHFCNIFLGVSSSGYARFCTKTNSGKSDTAYVHKFLMPEKHPGMLVDHINRDRLDNRRNNLRYIDISGSAINTSVRKSNKIGIKGVSKNKHGKYTAFFRGKNIGSFLTIDEASQAYENAVTHYTQNFVRVKK